MLDPITSHFYIRWKYFFYIHPAAAECRPGWNHWYKKNYIVHSKINIFHTVVHPVAQNVQEEVFTKKKLNQD